MRSSIVVAAQIKKKKQVFAMEKLFCFILLKTTLAIVQ